MNSSPAVSPLNETGQKGARFKCSSPGCSKTFRRRQELNRHISSMHLPNLPDSIYCRQAGCDWTGDRLEELRSHFSNRHPGIPLLEEERYRIYDARRLIIQVRNGEITKERAEFLGTLLFNSWALQSTVIISVG